MTQKKTVCRTQARHGLVEIDRVGQQFQMRNNNKQYAGSQKYCLPCPEIHLTYLTIQVTASEEFLKVIFKALRTACFFILLGWYSLTFLS